MLEFENNISITCIFQSMSIWCWPFLCPISVVSAFLVYLSFCAYGCWLVWKKIAGFLSQIWIRTLLYQRPHPFSSSEPIWRVSKTLIVGGVDFYIFWFQTFFETFWYFLMNFDSVDGFSNDFGTFCNFFGLFLDFN